MTTPKDPRTRPVMDIVRYHDILDELIHNPNLKNKIDWAGGDAARQQMIAIKRTLCWVLYHDEGRWLSQNMDKIEKALADVGFDLKRVQ